MTYEERLKIENKRIEEIIESNWSSIEYDAKVLCELASLFKATNIRCDTH